MQEQVNEKTVAVSVKTAKFTGEKFEKLILHLLKNMKKRQKPRDSPKIYKGKQTVKELVGQGAELKNIEIQDKSINKFKSIARKYGVDFSIQKDTGETPTKWVVFFKSRDAKVLETALKEYESKIIKVEKPSILSALRDNISRVRNAVVDRVKNKDKNIER